MARRIDPQAAKTMIHGKGELAFLDLREAGEFGEGHPLFAVPCPYSRLEYLARRLVPRESTPMLLADDGDGRAERAAACLEAMGYRDVATLGGGVAGWRAAGYTLFKGVNVPSKVLGELAEAIWRPATVDPTTMRQWLADGSADLFDARPPTEFSKMHVPGARCLPNGELAHRLDVLRIARDRALVVGCAGRTRGIVGAIGLTLLGCDKPVYALENGTQGWALAGLTLERGVAADPFPPLDGRSRRRAHERAVRFLRQRKIARTHASAVHDLFREESRTTFLFDVRSAAEACSDPVAAARHAPAGQLVQATDHYVGVRRARLVLCDDIGIRAGLAAFWLRQLGYEVFVATIDDDLRSLPAAAAAPPADYLAGRWEEAAAACDRIATGRAVAVDLRPSSAFRRSHVRNAVWSIRPRLIEALAQEPRPILLVADDAAVLAGAARDLRSAGRTDFAIVKGGNEALVHAGAPLESTPHSPDGREAIDFLTFVHDRHDGNLEASRTYLAWERGLVGQLDASERAAFRLESPFPA